MSVKTKDDRSFHQTGDSPRFNLGQSIIKGFNSEKLTICSPF